MNSQQESRQIRALEKIASELANITEMLARQHPHVVVPDWASGTIMDGDEVVGFAFPPTEEK